MRARNGTRPSTPTSTVSPMVMRNPTCASAHAEPVAIRPTAASTANTTAPRRPGFAIRR